MQTYNEFLNEETKLQNNLETALIGQLVLEKLDINILNESEEAINEGVKDVLHKMGIHTSKEPGIIEYAAKFTKGVGQIVYYAMKKDEKKVKEIYAKFKKEDVLDFFYKLDMATLHIITGPLHFIHATLGIHLAPAIITAAKKGAKLVDQIKAAIKQVKDKVKDVFAPKLQPVAVQKLNDIEGMLGSNA